MTGSLFAIRLLLFVILLLEVLAVKLDGGVSGKRYIHFRWLIN